MATRAIVFTQSNARIIPDPDTGTIEKLSHWKNVAFDPDLSNVEGVPPHFWKLVEGKVLPMSFEEREIRCEQIARHGIDNVVAEHKKIFKPRRIKLHHYDYAAYLCIIVLLIWIIKLLK